MKNAAALALAPLYMKEASATGLMEGALQSRLDTGMARAVGTTEIINTPSGAFNGAGGGMQAGLKVEILSPTQQMLTDFGVERAYLNGSHSTERVLPNDNLMYRC